MEKLYPGIFIPPLPRKKTVRSLDSVYLNKRLKVLENFVDYLLKSELLSVTTYVSDFLSVTDDVVFK